MGILDRLGNVIKSHINYDSGNGFEKTSSNGRSSGRRSFERSHDPDLNAAYEELDDFLRGNNGNGNDAKWKPYAKEREKTARPIPEDVKNAFAELKLTPEATAEECKEAYKKLLKIHHPDRHAKHEGNLKKATAKTAKVNDAYERLEKWFAKNSRKDSGEAPSSQRNYDS